MKNKFNFQVLLIFIIYANYLFASKACGTNFIFRDIRSFQVLGQLPDVVDYERLPLSAKEKVNSGLWNLSKHSAGINVKFLTNSTCIKIKWTQIFNPSTPDMLLTGLRGFDLYCMVNKSWVYVNSAKFQGKNNESILLENADSTWKEYMLFLPLFDEVTNVEIGIPENFLISKPIAGIKQPIVIYGTSVTQGASASRPGLSYISLLTGSLNREVINLGFSSNGKFEELFADYILSAKPALIILDCTSNSSPEEIKHNLPELITAIRNKDKDVPILMVESVVRENTYFDKVALKIVLEKNNTLKHITERLRQQAVRKLYYLSSNELVKNGDKETVDGTHPNDIGHYNFFIEIEKKIKKIIK